MLRGLPLLLLIAPGLRAQDVEHRIVPVPSGAHASGAKLTRWGDHLLLSWIEPAGEGGRHHALRFARLQDGRWSPARTIAEGSRWFVNWADFPAVGARGDALLASWLVRTGKRYAYDVHLARSVDDGASWQRLGSPHRDGTPTEHGFVSIVPAGDGFDVFWLDGREMVEGGSGNMALRTARVGADVAASHVLDPDVCTCCQVSAVRTSRGPIVVYRDHAKGEIRDISIVRQTTDGWSAPRAVADDGWLMPGCPVNGPHADAAGDHLAVAWFTAVGGTPKVQIAFSADCGESFAPPIAVDDDAPLGRVAVACIDDGAVVCWLDGAGDRAVIRLRAVGRDRRVGPAMRVADTSAARASGFPSMVRNGDRLVLAWRTDDEAPRLRSAFVPIAAVPIPPVDARDR